tara:strand:- start:1491 stop:1655 length:165 start_codon:yes stop_codon:yes gene_type:complete
MKTKAQWYTIKVLPIDGVREPYEFLIETVNLKRTMKKYTRNKEEEITATWEIVR